MAQQGSVPTSTLRLFGIGKERRVTRARRTAVPLDDGEKMKAHVRHIAVNVGCHELAEDLAELPRRGRVKIDHDTQDDRLLEPQVLNEEVRRDPWL